MSRYKTPKAAALKMSTQYKSLNKLLHGAVKSFSHDHPEWAIAKEARVSLVKRLDGLLRSEFARTLADKMLLDWLEAHRYEWSELCKIQGGLRKVIAEEMERRGDL